MKKLLSLVLILGICLFALCGCQKPEEGVSSSDASQTASSQEEGEKEQGEARIVKKDITIDTASYFVTLNDYSGYTIDWDAETPQAILNSSLESYEGTVSTITDRPIKNGDTANIDYVGKKDGVAFEGGTANGYDLVIGSGSFIPGFEEGLIGVESGETVDIDLTFPEEYHSAELAGADVVFTVTVNSITQKEYSKNDLYNAKLDSAFEVMLQYLLENSEIKAVSQADYDNYYSAIHSQYSSYYTEDQIKSIALNNAKSKAIIMAVAQKEGIAISEDEYKAELKSIATQYGVDEAEVEKQYGRADIEFMVVAEEIEDIFKQSKYIGKK